MPHAARVANATAGTRYSATLTATGQAENTYLLFTADNGYHMGEHRLMTGKQTAYTTDVGVPLVVIVVNDAGLTLIRRVQDRDFAGRRCEVDLVNPDFVALARAYGIPAELAETPEAVDAAVIRAVDQGQLSFIEYRPN